MNHILIPPVDDQDEDYYYLMRKLKSEWIGQAQSPNQLFETLVVDVVDDLPLIIIDLRIEKSELENQVKQILIDLRGADILLEEMTMSFHVEPLVARLVVIDGAIARMTAKWFEHYHKGLGKTLIQERLSVADITRAREVSILAVTEKIGLKLRRFGSRYQSICPLHQERTPSCTFFADTNRWHCFGCHHGGDGIDLVRKVLGLSFVPAVRFINS